MSMNASSTDFVLDEDLDDDEDVLAFHSQRQRSGGGAYDSPPTPPPPPLPLPPSPVPQLTKQTPPSDSVIIDGMPLKASRADLNTFLSGTGVISSLQLRRLESANMLRARICFETPAAAAAALQLDGSEFPGAVAVAIKPASAERWDSGCGLGTPPTTNVKSMNAPDTLPGGLFKALPDAATVTSSFWSAFGAARSAAEKLEERAKRLGEELEGRLHVSEKVAETRAVVQRADAELHVSERVGEMAAASKAAAGDIDETYGISKQFERIVGEVGSAARTVAKEMDENLRLSEKARNVTNMALQHDAIGPSVRTVVDSLGNSEVGAVETARKKKNYQPRGVIQSTEEDEPFATDVGTAGIGE